MDMAMVMDTDTVTEDMESTVNMENTASMEATENIILKMSRKRRRRNER